jgi:hypothetical protein
MEPSVPPSVTLAGTCRAGVCAALPDRALARRSMPSHIWIPKNPAESPEGLSAEIVSPCRSLPRRGMPSRTPPNRAGPDRAAPCHVHPRGRRGGLKPSALPSAAHGPPGRTAPHPAAPCHTVACLALPRPPKRAAGRVGTLRAAVCSPCPALPRQDQPDAVALRHAPACPALSTNEGGRESPKALRAAIAAHAHPEPAQPLPASP